MQKCGVGANRTGTSLHRKVLQELTAASEFHLSENILSGIDPPTICVPLRRKIILTLHSILSDLPI